MKKDLYTTKSNLNNSGIMIDEIYDDLNEKFVESYTKLIKTLGLPAECNEIKEFNHYMDIDLLNILTAAELLKPNEEALKGINKYSEYVFKLGIEIGVSEGKELVVKKVKSDKPDMETVMKLDPNQYLNFRFIPTFIKDLQDAIKNEKI